MPAKARSELLNLCSREFRKHIRELERVTRLDKMALALVKASINKETDGRKEKRLLKFVSLNERLINSLRQCINDYYLDYEELIDSDYHITH